MGALRTIATIRKGVDDVSCAVLKDEAVSVIAQSIANAAILYKDYAAIEVGEIDVKVLCPSDHRKTTSRQD